MNKDGERKEWIVFFFFFWGMNFLSLCFSDSFERDGNKSIDKATAVWGNASKRALD